MSSPSVTSFSRHGFALADTHHDVARDERPFAEILRKDMAPYRAAFQAGLAAVMPAHVIYPQCDAEPAGYSKYWLQDVLRGKLGFDGLIFSDDLSMAGASAVGGPPERARAALAAGCDMVLLCNNPAGQDLLLDSLGGCRWQSPNGWKECASRAAGTCERASPIAKPRRRCSSSPELSPLHVLAFGGVDLDLLALVDEGRDLHRDAGLHLRRLEGVGGGGVLDARLGVRRP